MATPTLTLINAGSGTLTDGFVGTNADAESATGWTDFSTLDTDIKVQGSNSISGVGRANNEDMYYDNGSAAITAAGKVFRAWFNTVNLPYMGTLAGANPYELLFYDGTTTTRRPVLGSDNYEGGWVYVFQDMDLVTTTNSWTANVTLANVQRWGWTTGHDSNAKNVINCWADAFRYLDGYYLTGGTSGDKVTIADVFTADMGGATPSAYGIVQRSRGIYFGTGTLQIGNGATTTWFEMDGEVLQFIDTVGYMEISAGLYEISATGAGCDCVINGCVIRGPSTGDSTRVYFDFSDTNHTLTFTGNLIVNGGTIVFASGQTVTGNIFDDCLQITHGGADMDGCRIQGYEGTAGTAALYYNVNADPSGEMDGMTFIKGTATTHAIELGPNTPSSITLNDWTVSGYNASNGQNDSVIYNNSGKAITVNIAGNTGTISYRNGTGASTVIASDPATTTITVRDINDNSLIEGARVLLIAADGTGDLPYQESVTITRGSDTAIWDERFEGTGYEETWTIGESVGGSSTLNEDYATSSLTNPPSTWDDQCLRIIQASGENANVGTAITAQDTIYFRMEFSLVSSGLAAYESTGMAFLYSGGTPLAYILITPDNVGPRLRLNNYASGSAVPYYYDITEGDYYVVEVFWDITTDTWEWRVNGVSQDSGDITDATRQSAQFNTLYIGGSSSYTFTAASEIVIDNVLISPTTWPSLTGTSVATVSHTGHGLSTGDIAYIVGADQQEYNGAREITVTGANSYTYTVAGTPTTPATGTITSTGGLFNDLTNASGIVTDTRSWSNAQPFTGRVRKSSSSPYYGTTPLNGTISTTAGFSGTFYLIPDE